MSELLLNYTDVSEKVALSSCVHEMYAGGRSDSLRVRISDTDGQFDKWNLRTGSPVEFKDSGTGTGKMFLYSSAPDSSYYDLRAYSMPPSGTIPNSKAWERVHFSQIGQEIAKRHGLELEEEAEYGNRKYLEKQDFILAKQKEQLAAHQSKLDELTLKVNDMETLIDEVSAAAYDKAVEVVTDVVRTETRKEDMRMIEDTRKWVLSPERKAPKATREYAAHRLDTVLDKFLKTMQTTAARLQEKLLKPEARQKGKEQIKEKARDSVLQLLNRLQAEQAQRVPGEQHTAEKSETRGDVY